MSAIDPQSERATPRRKIDLFVNREKLLGQLVDAVLRIGAGTHQILTINGPSGQGKSLLRERFLLNVASDQSLNHVKWGSVDLSKVKHLSPLYLLLEIRNALAKTGKMSFPAFDFAYELYWRETHPNQDLPKIERRWLDMAGEITGEGSAEAVIAAAEAGKHLLNIVAQIPALGVMAYILKRLGGYSIKKGYENVLLRLVPVLNDLFDDDQLISAAEIEELLPAMLISDINARHKDHSDERFLVVLDEYERVLEFGGASDSFRDSGFEFDFARARCQL